MSSGLGVGSEGGAESGSIYVRILHNKSEGGGIPDLILPIFKLVIENV